MYNNFFNSIDIQEEKARIYADVKMLLDTGYEKQKLMICPWCIEHNKCMYGYSMSCDAIQELAHIEDVEYDRYLKEYNKLSGCKNGVCEI